MHKKTAIIGGGAAGLMAAATIEELAPETGVLLFEKNAQLGSKVLISGGGRCNVTTGIFDVKELLKNYPRGAKFLMSAMFRFPPEKVIEWFEDHGVKMKTEEDLRVFPASNNGKDIVGALGSGLKRAEAGVAGTGAQFFLNAIVEKIEKVGSDGGKPKRGGAKFKIFLKDGRNFEVDSVIITTGGNAYRQTGSTGDGYAFAKSLGHSITKLAPSLHSFLVKDTWVSKLAGVAFKKAKITVGKYERTGSFVFTHKGVSGPAIFALSSMAAYEDFSPEKPLKININFFPEEKPEELKKRFILLTEQNGKKFLVNFLDLFLPKSLAEVFCEILKIAPKHTVATLNKSQRDAILGLFQNMKLEATGRGAGDEFVTAGGVDSSEVNTNTMESKICPGLYFAGEILDIDGFTGGFNLQAAWATGRLAGENAIQ
ncbi:MAG: NAD(P)/FAD-dependent oxidoreductase [Candidatus Gracilibacteria bacterium]